MKKTTQGEATLPKGLKKEKEDHEKPIEALELKRIDSKIKKLIKFKGRTEEEILKCRKEIEADGISAHGYQQDRCT